MHRQRIYLMLLGFVVLSLLQMAYLSNSHAGMDAKTSLHLRLKKPDIVEDRFIAAGNWYYVMSNDGRLMYDRSDVDHNGNNAGGEFPRGSNTTIVYAAGPWIGALKNNIPVVSETTFDTEFQPGRILNSGVSFYDLVADSVGNTDNRVYTLDRDVSPGAWSTLPQELRDRYGEYPAPIADAQTWVVFNDLDTTIGYGAYEHNSSPGLGLEITLESMVYNTPFLSNAVLLHYSITNKTNYAYREAYFGLWMEVDLVAAGNDLMGSDSTRGLGYIYNADEWDEPLAVGCDILQGPVVDIDSLPDQYAYKFRGNASLLRFNPNTKQYEPQNLQNDTVCIGTTTANIWSESHKTNQTRYYVLKGLDISGDYDPQSPNGWSFPGNPITGTGLINFFSGDQHFLTATGPFRIEAGGTQEIWAAVIGGEGTDRLDAVRNLFFNDDILQQSFEKGLNRSISALPSPSLTVTPGDGFVTLTWDSLAEEATDFIAELDVINPAHGYSQSLLLHDFQGYRVWKSLTGLPDQFQLLAQYDLNDDLRDVRQWYISDNGTLSVKSIHIGEDSGLEYTYTDHDVVNGRRYYYAVTTYDAQPVIFGPDSMYYDALNRTISKPLIMNPSTESSLMDNITAVTPQPKKAETKKELHRILVVPNPFYATTSEGKQIKFTGLPAVCTIRIFTVAGDLVKTLHHNSSSNNNRTDDTFLDEDNEPAPQETSIELWNLQNEKHHPIAPGVYIAQINSKLGAKIVKFAVVR